MDQYQRGQKEVERLDKAIGLRDAMWQNTLDRQHEADDRYSDELAYRRERDRKQDEREARRDGLYEEQARTAIARGARADARAEDEYEWLKAQRDKQAYQEENMPLFQQGWQDIADGNKVSDAFLQAVSDPRAGQYNPLRYIGGEGKARLAAGKTFVSEVRALMSDVENGKLDWNSEDGVKRINNPALLKSASVLYLDEIKTGIGDIDPKSGKRIQDKDLGSIMVTPDGAGVVLGLKVTYDDGSTVLRPVTSNRTARSDDEPKVIPISDFIGTGYKRAVISREIMTNTDSIRTSLGLVPGADLKGYRQAVVKVQADTEKAIGQLRRDSLLSPEEKEAAIAAERKAAKQQTQGLLDVFGVNRQKSAVPAHDSPSRSRLTQWASVESLRHEFLREAASRGMKISDNVDLGQLDRIYGEWKTLRQDSQTANALRDGNSSTTVKRDPRAAEKAAFNALIQPFVNGVPPRLGTDDGTTAYKAIVNR
ncbi:hypothetical protein V1481_02140 [Aeromonas enteropelogenes]|uniref:hypothetical protein n=1 Tax=Aeromonas enteropelogenes TaxID=29489 RepID=UPI003135B505